MYEQRFPQPFSLAVSKIAYLTYQIFCLGLLRPFPISFCLYTTTATHSRDILLPNIVLSVLQLFQFYLIFPIFTPPNLFFFLLPSFLKFNIHFVLKICGMFISSFW